MERLDEAIHVRTACGSGRLILSNRALDMSELTAHLCRRLRTLTFDVQGNNLSEVH